MPKNRPHPNEPKNARAAASVQKGVSHALPSQAKPDIELGSGLSGLAALRDALKRDAIRSERQRAVARETKRTADVDAALFRQQLGEVTPLASKTRATLTRTPPAPLPLQTRLDEEAVLNEAISDEFDPEMLLDTDESLFYCRPGVNEEVVRKLRRGAWIVQAQLDMHGMRREEAREALAEFIRESSKRGLRCLRVIHGKGLGSIGKEPVLKGKVRAWLVQKEEVIAFCQARSNDGGAGAVLVLLQPSSLITQPKP
ncbi:Smr/MutS family protein [Paraburkholderia jirisanensis]